MKITMLAYPGMTPLDLLGPLQVWSQWPDAEIQIVWKTIEPIMTDTGLAVVPTHSLAQAFTHPDIVCVPGGVKGTFDLLKDQEILDFLKDKGEKAQWLTSVCTGSLLLAAAGLLTGYKATTHWAAKDYLAAYGAITCDDRWVIDRNRATGGGVTAGIDFGLALMAKIGGEELAKRVQLSIEYAPQPPFKSGSPEQASKETLDSVIKLFTTQMPT